MNTLKIRFFILAAFFVILPVCRASGAEAPAHSKHAAPIAPFNKKAPVHLSADFLSYDQALNTYFARGNVVAVQDNTTLKADVVVADMTTGVATASGHVELVDEGGDIVKAESLVFNMKTQNAVLARGRISFKKQGILITGDTIKKTGPQTYEAEDVFFTSCECKDGETPAWHFDISSAKVTVGQYLTGQGAYFYVKNVPVLYTPYLSLPVKRERKSGFLSPQMGYSLLRGFVFDDAFYWAIADNSDATFYLDEETTRGTGGAVEYRYIRTRQSYGDFYFNYFHENDINRVRFFRSSFDITRPLNADDDRWQLKFDHTEDFGDGLVFKANINQVSDNEYFIDYGINPNEVATESTESDISLSKSWTSYSLVTQMRYFTNLMAANNSTTLQVLPEFDLTGSGQRILNTPFYFSMDSSAVDFYRELGLSGQRLDIHPRISLPLSAGGFDFTPSFAPRETLYFVQNDPNGSLFFRNLYDATVDMTTSFYRVFDTGLSSVTAIRHTIRPRITYVYIPATAGAVPVFDAFDAIPAMNLVTYSLTNILTGKYFSDGTPKYWDYVYFDLSQSFDFNEAKRILTSPTDKREPFSVITGELTLKPTELTTLITNSTYDIYTHNFTSLSTQLTAADKRGDNLNLLYSFLTSQPGIVTPSSILGPAIVPGQVGLVGTLAEAAALGSSIMPGLPGAVGVGGLIGGFTRYIGLSTKVYVTKTVDLQYLWDYSFDTHTPLQTSYAIDWAQQCWGATLTYTTTPIEKLVFLTFNLKGIGRIGGLHGGF